MIQWFDDLSSLQQIFAFFAIPSSLILIIQTILLLIGFSGDSDIDVDGFDSDVSFDQDGDLEGGSDGFALFSIRGIMAFLCIGGWSGIVFAGTDMGSALAIFLAILCGFAALVGMAYMLKLILSLQSSGNINLANAIGKVGQVYIPIPGDRKGSGKVNVIIQDKYTEINAITNEPETLKTGEAVRIVSTDETGLLVVERLKRQ
ncbi:MAG: hypothetical protein PHD66_03235 [Eubacteriales bacterium]|nr:hypothetical protein [Eubacteriales bacterium]